MYQCCFEFDDRAEPFGPRFVTPAGAEAFGRCRARDYPDYGAGCDHVSVNEYRPNTDGTVEWLREVTRFSPPATWSAANVPAQGPRT